VLLLAVIVGAGYYLVTRWDEVWATLSAVPWYSAVLSLVAVVLGILAGTAAWQQVVDDLGKPIGRIRGSQIYLVSQLGKYVPGAVWAYVLQMELGKKAGLSRARMFVGSLVQVGVAVVASLLVGLLALPTMLTDAPVALWLYVLLPFGLVALHPRVMTWGVNLVLRVLRRPPLEHPLRWSTILKTVAFTMLGYTLFGTHLWLLATADGVLRADVLLLCIGAIAIGLTAGMFVFILPSGAGVRDVLVAVALAPVVGGGHRHGGDRRVDRQDAASGRPCGRDARMTSSAATVTELTVRTPVDSRPRWPRLPRSSGDSPALGFARENTEDDVARA
jgi:hypothetical protein